MLFSMAFVLGALLAIVATAKLLQHRGVLAGEGSRKLVHVGMGCICLSFPWLFDEPLHVAVLALIAALGLWALRHVTWLRPWKTVLHQVDRQSMGDIFFPCAVALVFWLSAGDWVLYVLPIAILTVSDAVGALVGKRYGQSRYLAEEGFKSAEGSVAFFLSAFLITHLTLLVATPIGRVESILIGVLLGLFLVLVEAISWRGLDNLFLPVACFVLLKVVVQNSIGELATDVVILAGMCIVLVVLRRTTALTQTATFGVAVILFLSWSVGGWRWIAAPIAGVVGYALLTPGGPGRRSPRNNAQAVLAVSAPGLFWLFTSANQQTEVWIFPYGLSFAANLGMVALCYFRHGNRASRFALSAAIGIGFFVPLFPYLCMWPDWRSLRFAAAAVVILTIAIISFDRLQPGMADCPTDGKRWLRQGAIAFLASLAAAGVTVRLLHL